MKRVLQFIDLHMQIANVNTQTWTYTQIHTYTQILAYVQLPILFQPCVPLQPSVHLHCSQAPHPTTISTNPPALAKALIITHRLAGISIGGSVMAALNPFCFSAPQRLEADYFGRIILHYQFSS